MCRFTASRTPPAQLPSSPDDLGPGGFLDDFNWFDAIDEIPAPAQEQATWGPSATSSDSQDSCIAGAPVKSEGESQGLSENRPGGVCKLVHYKPYYSMGIDL
jgi:hypothetical protein